MAPTRIAADLHIVPVGAVNAYLIDEPDGMVLIDAGFPKKADAILDAIRSLGRSPADLRHIVLTHAHVDHIGSLAELVRATGAQTWMHELDVPIAERGSGFRPMRAAPGLFRAVMFRMFVPSDPTTEPARIDHHVNDGDVLPLAGGLRAIHAPGHCLGQIALLWADRGVLFAGDVCANLFGLGAPLGYEDEAEGVRSQRKLAALNFETACFGHGKPIVEGAARKFRERWNVADASVP